MDKKILVVLGLAAVVLLVSVLNGKITGNSFAYNLPRSCTDSDGYDLYNQGTVEFKDRTSVKPQSATDTCVNAANLLEHYCEGIAHLTETVPCRCEEGACKK